MYSDEDSETSDGSGQRKRFTYLLPGDATYGLDLLDKEEPDGINDDPVRALQALKTMKQFAVETDVIILPSHDPDTPELLAERKAFRPRN